MDPDPPTAFWELRLPYASEGEVWPQCGGVWAWGRGDGGTGEVCADAQLGGRAGAPGREGPGCARLGERMFLTRAFLRQSGGPGGGEGPLPIRFCLTWREITARLSVSTLVLGQSPRIPGPESQQSLPGIEQCS